MAEVASAYVSILPSAKGFGSKLNSQVSGDLDSSGKKMGSRLGSAMKGGALAVLGGAALAGAFLKDAVGAASDAQQAIGGVEAVFGKYANGVLRDSKKAAQGLGLSAAAYNELITVSGAMLKNKGIEDFAKQSTNLIGVGADLSAMFGGTTKDAVAALNAAMRGESDPIERYGISLGEAAVKAELFANNQGALTGAALEQAKTQARLAIIMRQSADAQGAFGREADTLAGKQARLSAQFDNFKSTLGTALLPVITKVFGFLNDTALPAVANFGNVLQSSRGPVTGFAAVISRVVEVARSLAQWFMGSVVPAIRGALIPVIARGREEFGKLRAAVQQNRPQLQQLLGAFLAVANFVATKLVPTFLRFQGTVLVGLISVVRGVIAVLGAGVSAFNSIRTAILDGATAAGRFAAGVREKVNSAVGFVKAIPGQITAVFSGAATLLYDAGGRLMSGLAAGIRAKITEAVNEVKAGLQKIKDMLPGSPIKSGPLKPWNSGRPGEMLMEFLAKGIAKGGEKSRKALEGQLEKLKGTLSTLKSDFSSLAESVSSAFTGNLFEATTGSDFIASLTAKKGELTGLLSSFKTLVGWGVPGSFLSQLFASGNGALITELAGMGQAGAVSTASLFGEVQSLGSQLGTAVAANDYGPDIREQTAEIKALRRDIAKLPKAVEDGTRKGTKEGNDDRSKDTRQRERAGR